MRYTDDHLDTIERQAIREKWPEKRLISELVEEIRHLKKIEAICLELGIYQIKGRYLLPRKPCSIDRLGRLLDGKNDE